MKINWTKFLAFFVPLYLAVGSFYLMLTVMDGMTDCRGCNFCNPFSLNCADQHTLFLKDLFAYSGIGLLVLSSVLPAVISNRTEKIQRIHFE
jgi:hypothetical protein